jgi:hypothetical protein
MEETYSPKKHRRYYQTGGLIFHAGAPAGIPSRLFWLCVLWEQWIGEGFSSVLGLPKMPVLFGLLTIFKVLAGIVNLDDQRGRIRLGHLVHIPAA